MSRSNFKFFLSILFGTPCSCRLTQIILEQLIFRLPVIKAPSTRIRFHNVFNRFHIAFISLSRRWVVFTENDITAFLNLSTLETVFKNDRFRVNER